MFFLPMGLLMKTTGFVYTGTADITALDIGGVLYNISAATVGNIVGGAVFVGLIYWLIYAKKPTK
jgi:formate/nitrite transporter FocA (FNT family)